MLTKELKKAEKDCLGCGACESVCTSHALKVKWQAEGKADISVEDKRCRDCFMCEAVCPQLHAREDNLEEPEGKVLTNLPEGYTGLELLQRMAKEVLAQGGYVCGPAWDEGFREVSYIVAADEEKMRSILWQVPLHVQTSHVYRKIEVLLGKGKQVLFCGKPCQVAALRNVLDMDSMYLLTVSFPCQGVIVPGLFQQYMDEISGGRKVASASFYLSEEGTKGPEAICSRSMIYWKKWPETIHISFEDGTSYIGTMTQDALVRGWHENLNIFKGCADCKFAQLPQQSDITLCDVSLIACNGQREANSVQILLNNGQGARFFRKVMDAFTESEAKFWEIPSNRAELFLLHNPVPQLVQERFFEMNKHHSLSKSTAYVLQGLFDVALVGPLHWPDYGLQLSYYALYKVLKELGYETLLLTDKREWYQAINLFGSEAIPWYDLGFLEEAGKRLNASVGCFMVGPGPVWDEELMKACASGNYVLDFVESFRYRLAYGSSLGKFIRNDSPGRKNWLENMKAFDDVFVAAESDVQALAREKISAAKALSPILLCSPQVLRELAGESSVLAGGEYLFSYLVQPEENGNGLEAVADYFDLPLVTMSAADIDASQWLVSYERNRKLEDWLKYLQESTFVVTDSPQAVYLALMYEKNFIFVQGWHRRSAEVKEAAHILKELGLGQRIVDMMSDLPEEAGNEAIDYEPVRIALADMRKGALGQLRACLQKGLSLVEQV